MTEPSITGAGASGGAPADLLARWERLRAEEPGARPRDAALRLGVGEAELVAARCGGGGVVRLDDRWGAMFEAFPGLGPVMTLTRNESAVHEKTGRFEKVSVFGKGVLVLGADIDLRVDLGAWRYGYVVTDARGDGELRSLQFFDAAGDAVQKIYLRDGTDRAAWDRLVAAHTAADQSPGERIERPAAPEPAPVPAVDAEALRARWRGLQDVHEFGALLGAFGIGRVRAFREVGTAFAEPIRPEGFCAALEQAAASGLPIMIFVPSPGNVQIHTGPVHRLQRMGPWFNVLDPGFNLHLRDGDIATAWAVFKPTRDGGVTSIEIFDAQDRQIAWMFGQRDPGAPEREEWRRLVAGLPRLESDRG